MAGIARKNDMPNNCTQSWAGFTRKISLDRLKGIREVAMALEKNNLKGIRKGNAVEMLGNQKQSTQGNAVSKDSGIKTVENGIKKSPQGKQSGKKDKPVEKREAYRKRRAVNVREQRMLGENLSLARTESSER